MKILNKNKGSFLNAFRVFWYQKLIHNTYGIFFCFIISAVNGYSDGTIRGLTLGAGTQFIHLFNIGSKFESIHLSGIGLMKTNNLYINNDVVGLHPGTSVTVRVSQSTTGNSLLSSLGTDRHWNNLQAFINVPPTSSGAS